MLQWIELLTKQFNNSQAACEVKQALHPLSCFPASFAVNFLFPFLPKILISIQPLFCNDCTVWIVSFVSDSSVCYVCSGFWIRWRMTTGGPCRSSSSVPIRSSGRWACVTNQSLPNHSLVLCLDNLDVLLNTHTINDVVCCDVLDVPEVVYPCDPETEASPRSPVPAAGDGGRVCDTFCLLKSKHYSKWPKNKNYDVASTQLFVFSNLVNIVLSLLLFFYLSLFSLLNIAWFISVLVY